MVKTKFLKRYEIIKDTEFFAVPGKLPGESLPFFHNDRYKYFPLKKGNIVAVTNRHLQSVPELDELLIIANLENSIVTYSLHFYTKPYVISKNTDLQEVEFIELRIHFFQLPKYLNNEYIHQDIVKWRLLKGV